MLEAIRGTGARLRPREPVLRRGLRRAEAGRLPHLRGAARAGRRRPHLRAGDAGAASPRLPRARDRAGHQHARLLDGRGRRPVAGGRQVARVAARRRGERRGLRGRPRRAGQRHSRAPVDHEGRARRRRLPLHRAQVLRQPHARCGPSSACTAWTRATRPRPRSSTPSCPRATEGYSIKDTWDVLGMRATASHDTILRRRGGARPVHRPGGARRVRGRRPLHPGRLPVGAHRLRQRLLRPRAAPARPDGGEREEEDVAWASRAGR